MHLYVQVYVALQKIVQANIRKNFNRKKIVKFRHKIQGYKIFMFPEIYLFLLMIKKNHSLHLYL